MALRLSTQVIILSLVKLSLGGLVLPRPPSSSSPNQVKRMPTANDDNDNNNHNSNKDNNNKMFDERLYNDRIVYQNSRTNVEKPNTDNYKLLEIEFRNVGEEEELEEEKRILRRRGELNFGEILREVFKEEEEEEELLSKNKKNILKLPEEQMNFDSLINKINNLKKVNKSLNDEKLYYLKKGNKILDVSSIKKLTSIEPRSYLKSIQIYDSNKNSIDELDKKRYATKSFYRPKKYRNNINNNNNNNDIVIKDFTGNINNEDEKNSHDYTTENSLPTSSELPKQIPPPPSRVPSQINFTNTTPVLKFMSRRTDILPNGYVV